MGDIGLKLYEDKSMDVGGVAILSGSVKFGDYMGTLSVQTDSLGTGYGKAIIEAAKEDCVVNVTMKVSMADVKACSERRVTKEWSGKGTVIFQSLNINEEAEVTYNKCTDEVTWEVSTKDLNDTVKDLEYKYKDPTLIIQKNPDGRRLRAVTASESESDFDSDSDSDFNNAIVDPRQLQATTLYYNVIISAKIGNDLFDPLRGTATYDCGGLLSANLKYNDTFDDFALELELDVKTRSLFDSNTDWTEWSGSKNYGNCAHAKGTGIGVWTVGKNKHQLTLQVLKFWCATTGQMEDYGNPFFFTVSYMFTKITMKELLLPDVDKASLESYKAAAGQMWKDCFETELQFKVSVQFMYNKVDEEVTTTLTLKLQLVFESFGITLSTLAGVGVNNDGKFWFVMFSVAVEDVKKSHWLTDIMKSIYCKEIAIAFATGKYVDSDGNGVDEGFTVESTFALQDNKDVDTVAKDKTFSKIFDGHSELKVQLRIRNKQNFRAHVLMVGKEDGLKFDKNGTFILSNAGIFFEKEGTLFKMGIAAEMLIKVGDKNPLQLGVNVEIMVERNTKGLLASFAIFVSKTCPAITATKFCSKTKYCCWRNPLGMMPRGVIVFPFFFKFAYHFTLSIIVELGFQFTIFIGEMSFELAFQFNLQSPWLNALYMKIANLKLADILEDLLDCDDCLSVGMKLLLQVSVELFEISVNKGFEPIIIGTKIVPPGLVLDIKNFNLWDIIILERAYLKLIISTAGPSFVLKVKIPPIDFKVLKIGYKDIGTEVELKLSLDSFYFKLQGGISLFSGLIEREVLIEITPAVILMEFEWERYGWKFWIKIDAKTPFTHDSYMTNRGDPRQIGRRTQQFRNLADGLKNAGSACYKSCEKKSGPCPFCGTGYCCKQGFNGGERGCTETMGGADDHQCVQQPNMTEVKFKDPNNRTCTKTTRAVRPPNLVTRRGNCTSPIEIKECIDDPYGVISKMWAKVCGTVEQALGTCPPTSKYLCKFIEEEIGCNGIFKDSGISVNMLCPMTCKLCPGVDFREWGGTFGEVGCPNNEMLSGFTVNECNEEPGKFRQILTCLRSMKTTSTTLKFSRVIDAPDNGGFGMKALKQAGLVTCGAGFAMNSFEFAPTPGRPSNWTTRVFKLNCVQPAGWHGYRFVRKNLTEVVTKVTGSCVRLANYLSQIQQYMAAGGCKNKQVLRSFRVVECKTILKFSDPSYALEFECVNVEYVDRVADSPANAKLPISAFNFADMEGEMVQLTVCKGGKLPAIKSADKIQTVEMGTDDKTEMICPIGWAMISFHGKSIKCFEPGILSTVASHRKWSSPFTIQDSPVDCGQGLVVGYKCEGVGCNTKRIYCQRYKKFDGSEDSSFKLQARLSLDVGSLLKDKIAPAIREILFAAAKGLRKVQEAMDEKLKSVEKAEAEVNRIKKKFNANIDAAKEKLDELKVHERSLVIDVSEKQSKHDLCSGWECAGTFTRLSAAFAELHFHQTAVAIAIAALEIVRYLVNKVLALAQTILRVAKSALRLASWLLKKMADGLEALGKGLANKLSEAGDLVGAAMDAVFNLKEFFFGAELIPDTLTVWLKVDLVLFSEYSIKLDLTLELNITKIWESVKSSLVQTFNPFSGSDGTKRAAYTFSPYGSDEGETGTLQRDIEAVSDDLIYEQSLNGVSLVPDDTDDEAAVFESLVTAVNNRVSRRGPGAFTRAEARALDYYNDVATCKRREQVAADQLTSTFDANRGLKNFCKIRRESNNEDGFRSIRTTHSVARRSTPIEEFPECLFRTNPRLRSVILEGHVEGTIPDLPAENELEVFAVRRARLSGNWDDLLGRARNLRIFHVQYNELSGHIDRTTWPPALESISLVDNAIEMDPVAMFNSLQQLPRLQQVFWDRNLQIEKEEFKSVVRTVGGISKFASRVLPEFSVMYGSMKIKGIHARVCGDCALATMSPFECFREPCADASEFEDLLARLHSTLHSVVTKTFSHIFIERISVDGQILFRAQTPFMGLSAQQDILEGALKSIESQMGVVSVEARFGCTPGAVGPQCEYICPTGWRRHGFTDSTYPECAVPVDCNDQCTDQLALSMSVCTNFLYDKENAEECRQSIMDAHEDCDTCQFFNGAANDYQGFVTRTLNNLKCFKWDEVTSFVVPDIHDWSHDYCRNYEDSSKDTAWCFTNEEGDWEYCDIGTPSFPRCHNDGPSCFDIALSQFQEILR